MRLDNDKVANELNDLIKLDFDAIEAYEAAIKRLDNDVARSRLNDFLQDHRRHTVNLAAEVQKLGKKPADGPGAMRLLTEGAVVMGGLMNDKGILRAMSSNEAITNRSYESAVEKLAGHPAVEVVRQNREDERRHKQWIDAAIEADDFASVDYGARRQEGTQTRPGDIR